MYEINCSTINYYDLQSPSKIYKPDLIVHTKMSPFWHLTHTYSVFKPQHNAAVPSLYIITDNPKTCLRDQTEKPQNARLLQVLIRGTKSGGVWPQPLPSDRKTVQTCERSVNQTITQTHSHTPQATLTQTHCPRWRLPVLKQDCNSHCSPTSKASRKWRRQPQSGNQHLNVITLYEGFACTCSNTNTQWPLPEIAWTQRSFDSLQ